MYGYNSKSRSDGGETRIADRGESRVKFEGESIVLLYARVRASECDKKAALYVMDNVRGVAYKQSGDRIGSNLSVEAGGKKRGYLPPHV